MATVRARILTAACASLIMASVLWGETKTAGVPFDSYAVIAERNIYLKDRRPTPRPTGRFTSILRPEPPPPSPEESTVLTGVVRHGNEFIAFFEDLRTGTTKRVTQGQTLLGGTVGTISLDYVEYVKAGQVARIGIRDNLAKRPQGPAPTVSAETPPPAGTTSASLQPAAPSDEASILEMLRKRRQQEMGNN